ncbi:CDC27 family protein [Sulfurovum sp. XTW-4]|uniref:CDC27 family protein n=1 Tax=Sulfurovum xiamenensis TaxID=3019066 RepID=A0ABT7QPI2_9BACT|nr:CDC27 family protein [Sulfurovum xiamenensis]MDM5262687.1 CDC27 family protein [Sulfurovum xiamenensis]
MYEIKQLEDEWKRYRKKKLRPWYIGTVIFIVLTFTSIFFQTDHTINFSALKTYFEISKVNHSSEKQEESKDSATFDKMNTKETVLLNDPLEKLEVKDNMIEMADRVVKEHDKLLVDIPILDDTNEPSIEEEMAVRKNIHLEIIDSTSVSGYKDVEKRFFESHDIDDALFLAKSYYKNGNYEKAEYWALETNKLDESKEESLLIFVKSKVKLGHKNEALSILNAYLKQSDSKEAKKLLYRIQNDKL